MSDTDTETVTITDEGIAILPLAVPIPPGEYTVTVREPGDGSTFRTWIFTPVEQDG